LLAHLRAIAVAFNTNKQSLNNARNYEENQLVSREYSNESIPNLQNGERTQLVEQEKTANIAKLELEKNDVNTALLIM
jgi:hypothetical protein